MVNSMRSRPPTGFPKIARKDYQIGLNLTGSSVDDPDQQFYENYYCGSQRNYSGYCNKEIDQLTDQQSEEPDQIKRRKMVWDIDSKLQEDAARPIIMHNQGRDLLAALRQGRHADGPTAAIMAGAWRIGGSTRSQAQQPK